MRDLTSAEQYRQFVSSSAINSAKYFFDHLLVGSDEKLENFISDIQTGKTPPKSTSKYYDGSDIKWFKPGDIGRDTYLSQANSHVSNVAITDKKATLYKERTILITCIGDIGRIGILKEDSSSNQQITGILTNDQLLPEFAYLYLASHRENFTNSGVLKTTLEIINQKKIRSLPIKVPSIEIQKAVIQFYFSYINKGFPDTVPVELKFCKNQLIDFARLVDSSKVFSKNINNELIYQQTLLKKLRQQILQEAIEGKLTKEWRLQNPDTEPASELLKRIQAEKELLLKENKIKKQKELPVILEKEKSFKLPSNWKWTRLQDLSKLITDGKHGDCQNLQNSGYYFLSAKDIQNKNLIYENARQIVPDEFQEVHNRTDLEAGDICMVNTGATVGKLAIAPDHPFTKKTTFQKSVAVLKVIKPNVNQEFIGLFLNCQTTNLLSKSKGGAINNLLLGDLKCFLVPLPPILEQHKIVKKVDKLFAICDELEAQIDSSQTNAKELMKAVLKEAFTQEDKVA